MVNRGQRRCVRTFQVAPRFKKIVESTRYKSSPYTACTALKVPSVGKAMVKVMTKKIQQECKFLGAK